MSDYLEQLKIAIKATVFRSSSSYSWFGKESAKLSPKIKRALTPRTARNYLLYQLQFQLYTDFYIRGSASAGMWSDAGNMVEAVTFVERLSEANTGNGFWEHGWEVLSTAPDEVVVRRGGVKLWVSQDDCVVPEGGLMKPGSKLWLYVPKELIGISPGYYMALSNQAINPDEAKGIVRLYWNLRAEGAEPFVRDATRLLNEAGLFFKLKVLSDPRSYMRCDAAVVYVCQDDYLPVAEILSGIYPQVARYLKPSVPMFTKLLAPGVGLAEDPGQAESFGQHRCRLLAESMIRAFEEGARTLDDRLRIATDCYASAGIRLSHPYLNPKSSDIYTVQRLG